MKNIATSARGTRMARVRSAGSCGLATASILFSAGAARADTLTFDSRNRLVRAQRGAVIESFRYDGDGKLVGRCESRAGAVECKRVLWDPRAGVRGHVAGESRAGASTPTWLSHGPLGPELSRKQEGVRFTIRDHLGTVRGELDSSGALTYRQGHHPFGLARAQVGAPPPLGFAGELQGPTSLVFLRARHMAPALGRFLQRDTWRGSGAPGSLNRYAYAQGSPLSLVDPSGHAPYRPPLGWYAEGFARGKFPLTSAGLLGGVVFFGVYAGVVGPYVEMKEAEESAAWAAAHRAGAELRYQTIRYERLRAAISQGKAAGPSSPSGSPSQGAGSGAQTSAGEGGGASPPVGGAGAGNEECQEGEIPLYRLTDPAVPETYRAPLYNEALFGTWKGRPTAIREALGRSFPTPSVAYGHMTMSDMVYPLSPYVSATTDPARLAHSKDGVPGGVRDLLRSRPELLVLCVPEELITTPEQVEELLGRSLAPQRGEGEVLIRPPGGSIEPYILRRLTNPHHGR